LRIAFLQSALPPVAPGGVAHQVDLLARSMAERGHEVTVFTLSPVSDSRKYRTVVLSRPSIGPFAHNLGTGLAFRKIAFGDFDVVHAHGDAWCIPNLPLVRTFHGTAIQEAMSATSTKRQLAQVVHYGLELISSFRAPITTAVSHNTGRFMPGIDHVVPNAVDQGFKPGADGDRSEQPTILLVAGLLGGRKRGHLVLSAFKEVRKRIPSARLIVVTHDRLNGPGIDVHHSVSTEDLAKLFQRSWVLCSASSYEAFGIPLAEAMASGLPVVSTANPGAREVLRNGQLGMIVKPEDLSSALISFISDKSLANEYRRRGLVAASAYSLDSVIHQYETVYAEAIDLWSARKGPLP
jgi:phosphatidylinositol alpha-mannosyltransferase